MADAQSDGGSRDSTSDQRDVEHYLPGGPLPSPVPGHVERFLSRHLRRRGRLRRILVPKYGR